MTTQNWSFPFSNSSDADFRAWGQDLSAKLALVGLVQTSDTGQINWATATRPTTNSFAGYEIWRYPDSSIFMRWEFGTFDVAGAPSVRITVGTGSNGSGTLTGTVSGAQEIGTTGTIVSPGTSRQSLMCFKDNFFGFLGYVGASVSGLSKMFFAVAPTVTSQGVPTTDGATVYWLRSNINNTARVQSLNFATATARASFTDGSYSIVPQALTSSLVGSDPQVFVHWTALPRVQPVMQVCTVISTEFSPNFVTFQTALVGSTPRTYIALDTTVSGAAAGGSTYKLAMLWE